MMHDQATSLITVLSSTHGRMRREQRDINKRDIQKAIKYGTRSRGWKNAWKVEYEGITYITDSSLRKEITVYPSPLPLASLDFKQRCDHIGAKEVIQLKHSLCASHTVLVVDNSGSMATHDIVLYRCRQNAAYTMMALELVADQLINETANNSDVVSLVEFSHDSEIVFCCEPMSWQLYNMILERRDTRSFAIRQDHIRRDVFRADSNYMNALDLADGLLNRRTHEGCALSLFFISDGAPSDARQLGITPQAATRRLCSRMADLAKRFGDRLTIHLAGFGNEIEDFSVMLEMAGAANNAFTGTKAQFIYCDKIGQAIGTAVSGVATSLTETRTRLQERGAGNHRTRRKIDQEDGRPDWQYHWIVNHYMGYNKEDSAFIHYGGVPPGAVTMSNKKETERRRNDPPPFLAISSKHSGMGAERVAFRCFLADQEDSKAFQFGPMVAKETNHIERIEENIDFHRTFLETQSIASCLAEEFNKYISELPGYRKQLTPKISFLACSILVIEDHKWPGGIRGVLVEKMLDIQRYGWRKWNDNAGGVDGRASYAPIDVDYELKLIEGGTQHTLDNIVEEDSDESDNSDDEASDSEEEDEQQNFGSQPVENEQAVFRVNPSDYLQAFTHFTYRYTNRRVMVCDLQGVFNIDMVPPTFELTDPVVHYNSASGRRRVFGDTDKGVRGTQLFFNSHRCNQVCKMLLRVSKNKEWLKTWRRNRNERS